MSTPSIQKIIASKNTAANTLLTYCHINNPHVSGFTNTHLNGKRASPTQIIPEASLQPYIIASTQAVPPPQPRSTTHYRHEHTGRRLRHTVNHPTHSNCLETQQITNAMETPSTEEPMSKRTRFNCRLSITPTQILHTSPHCCAANPDAMTPAVNDSSTEPPSKRTRSTMKNTLHQCPNLARIARMIRMQMLV